jgi:hypothetical protein
MDKHCLKCGKPIAFKLLPTGKWCPTNPDGSDHWDDCRGIVRNPEWAAKAMKQHPPVKVRPRGLTHVWNGVLPPWVGSLGDYREFTADEKANRSITRRVA